MKAVSDRDRLRRSFMVQAAEDHARLLSLRSQISGIRSADVFNAQRGALAGSVDELIAREERRREELQS